MARFLIRRAVVLLEAEPVVSGVLGEGRLSSRYNLSGASDKAFDAAFWRGDTWSVKVLSGVPTGFKQ